MFTGLEAAHAHPARRWTTAVSFSLQAMLVAAVLIFPIFRPANLSDAFKLRHIFLPEPQGEMRSQSNPNVNHTLARSMPLVPPLVVRTGPAVNLSTPGPEKSSVTGPPSIGIVDPNSTIQSILSDPRYQPLPTHPQAAVSHAAPVSVIMQGNLLRKIEPHYPAIAQQMGIQGTVVIKALISSTGTVERPQVVSGQPFLAIAALNAVKKWRYRPYYLNGQPVEVETEITVNFVLQR